MQAEIPTVLTMTGVARELRVANATLKRRIEGGQIKPDMVLVETLGVPGSLLFRSERLPEIALALKQPKEIKE